VHQEPNVRAGALVEVPPIDRFSGEASPVGDAEYVEGDVLRIRRREGGEAAVILVVIPMNEVMDEGAQVSLSLSHRGRGRPEGGRRDDGLGVHLGAEVECLLLDGFRRRLLGPRGPQQSGGHVKEQALALFLCRAARILGRVSQAVEEILVQGQVGLVIYHTPILAKPPEPPDSYSIRPVPVDRPDLGPVRLVAGGPQGPNVSRMARLRRAFPIL
jgi:hypothetical protein